MVARADGAGLECRCDLRPIRHHHDARAGLVAVVVARGDLLLEATVRARNAVRLAAIAVLSAVGVASVLLIPFTTGNTVSPFASQRSRQVGKGISPWASYGDLVDLLWPDGSRPGEALSALALALLVGGLALGLLAVLRGRYRRVVLAGFVATGLWVVGLNYALAELFANYVGLGVPFIALLCAPGWVYLFEQVASTTSRRVAAGLAAGLVLVVGLVGSTRSIADQIDTQERFESLREDGQSARSTDGRSTVRGDHVVHADRLVLGLPGAQLRLRVGRRLRTGWSARGRRRPDAGADGTGGRRTAVCRHHRSREAAAHREHARHDRRRRHARGRTTRSPRAIRVYRVDDPD